LCPADSFQSWLDRTIGLPEAPEAIRDSEGRLTTEGHVGGTACMSVRSMGIGRQNFKPSKNNIIRLLLLHCRRHRCTYRHVVTYSSTVHQSSNCPKYPSLIVDFHKLAPTLRRNACMPHYPVVKLPETELGLCLASSADQCTKLQLYVVPYTQTVL